MDPVCDVEPHATHGEDRAATAAYIVEANRLVGRAPVRILVLRDVVGYVQSSNNLGSSSPSEQQEQLPS